MDEVNRDGDKIGRSGVSAPPGPLLQRAATWRCILYYNFLHGTMDVIMLQCGEIS